MDVGLVFDQCHWLLFHPLAATAGQIAVQLVLEEFSHPRLTVQVLHHHQCGVLRQRFVQHGHTLHTRTDCLVCPPLVTDLVCGHVGDVVDIR